jgi:site-specific DNA recombinase
LNAYYEITKNKEETTAPLLKQLNEIKTKAERLEERFVLEEINKEMFDKYQAKFKEELDSIQQQLQKTEKKVSNPEDCVEKALDMAVNLPKMWNLAKYQNKQKLQYLLFPDGIFYNKVKDECRTEKINPVFLAIALKSATLQHKKTGITSLNMSYPSLVGPPGIEPGTY